MMSSPETDSGRGDPLRDFSFDEQLHLMREIERSPAFGRHIADLLRFPDSTKQIRESSMKAAINELDPSMYQESAGLWPVLREQARMVPQALPRAVDKVIDDLSFEEVVAFREDLRGLAGAGGLGDWEAFWGAVGDIGVGLYGNKTRKDIAKIQDSTQRWMAQRELERAEREATKQMELTAELQEKKITVNQAAREILAVQAAEEPAIPWGTVLPVGAAAAAVAAATLL